MEKVCKASYDELPDEHKKQALQWAIDAYNALYRDSGLPLRVDEHAPEVLQLVHGREYTIEYGEYERGMPYERLAYQAREF